MDTQPLPLYSTELLDLLLQLLNWSEREASSEDVEKQYQQIYVHICS